MVIEDLKVHKPFVCGIQYAHEFQILEEVK